MTARPVHLTVRPDLMVRAMMDPLSQLLRSVRLTGGVFLDVRLSAPWGVQSHTEVKDFEPFLATSTQIISYHYVIDGRLLITVEGEPTMEVRAGEVVLLPRNDSHTVVSEHGLPTVVICDLVQPSEDGGIARISYGGGGAPTQLVCGFLGSNEAYSPLIASLPKLLKVDIRQSASREWVEASMRFAANELTEGRLASSGVLSRLSELLFVEAVREYSSTLGGRATGWLKGLADPQIGKALALIHSDASAAWSAEALAKEAALSRSAFVERFTSLVGVPPIRYLTVLRLQTARLSLQETRKTIAQLAHSVGYESEEAFSRAFKREFGLPPARWREQQAIS